MCDVYWKRFKSFYFMGLQFFSYLYQNWPFSPRVKLYTLICQKTWNSKDQYCATKHLINLFHRKIMSVTRKFIIGSSHASVYILCLSSAIARLRRLWLVMPNHECKQSESLNDPTKHLCIKTRSLNVPADTRCPSGSYVTCIHGRYC